MSYVVEAPEGSYDLNIHGWFVQRMEQEGRVAFYCTKSCPAFSGFLHIIAGEETAVVSCAEFDSPHANVSKWKELVSKDWSVQETVEALDKSIVAYFIQQAEQIKEWLVYHKLSVRH